MVTGASTADLAVLLVDARKGVLTQTRRHSLLAKLVGIRHMVVAVTKMDLVDYDQAAFEAMVSDYRAFAESIGIDDWIAIPVSGLNGDNVAARSAAMGWYNGPSLIEHLETRADRQRRGRGQAVPHAGAMGQSARPGFSRLRRPDRQRHGARRRRGPHPAVGPDHARSRGSCTMDGDLDQAVAGQSVTLTLGRRGRLLARRRDRRRQGPAAGRRPVRGDHGLDGRRASWSRAAAIG